MNEQVITHPVIQRAYEKLQKFYPDVKFTWACICNPCDFGCQWRISANEIEFSAISTDLVDDLNEIHRIDNTIDVDRELICLLMYEFDRTINSVYPQNVSVLSGQWSGPNVDFHEWWGSKDHTYGGDATAMAIAGLAWEAAYRKYAPPLKNIDNTII